MKNAIIYARQSFGKEENSLSIAEQVQSCKDYAQAQGMKVLAVFQDSNCSSELYPDCEEGRAQCKLDKAFQKWQRDQRTPGRKEFKKGLGDAFNFIEQRHPDCLIVYNRNRLGRVVMDSQLNKFFNQFFKEHGTRLACLQENLVMDLRKDSPMMQLFMEMKNQMDDMSLEEKKAASIAVKNRLKDERKIYSRAYAVLWDKTAKKISFDPIGVEVVKEIFKMFLAGASWNGLMNWLNMNKKNLVNVCGKRTAKQWYITNVIHMIQNPVYCGYSYDTQKVLGKIANLEGDAPISYLDWKKAQELCKERTAYSRDAHPETNSRTGYNLNGHKNRAETELRFHPYTGLIYCPCGRRMIHRMDHGKSIYECRNGRDHTGARLQMDASFIKAIEALMKLRLWEVTAKAQAGQSAEARIADLTAQLDQINQKRQRMFDLATEGELGGEFKAQFDALKVRRAEIEEALNVAKAEQDQDWKAVACACVAKYTALEAGTLDHLEYKEVLNATIKKITVQADKLEVILWDDAKIDIQRITTDKRGHKVVEDIGDIPLPNDDFMNRQGKRIILMNSKSRIIKSVSADWDDGECHISY